MRPAPIDRRATLGRLYISPPPPLKEGKYTLNLETDEKTARIPEIHFKSPGRPSLSIALWAVKVTGRSAALSNAVVKLALFC